MISQGRTTGRLSRSNPGMRGLRRTLEARALNDIAVALALIRPKTLREYGGEGNFLKRLFSQAGSHVRYGAFCVSSAILWGDPGRVHYQEQVIRCAQAVAAMSAR